MWGEVSQQMLEDELEDLFYSKDGWQTFADEYTQYFMDLIKHNSLGKYIAAELGISYPLELRALVFETLRDHFFSGYDMNTDGSTDAIGWDENGKPYWTDPKFEKKYGPIKGGGPKPNDDKDDDEDDDWFDDMEFLDYDPEDY